MFVNLVKRSVLCALFYFVFITLPYVQGTLVMNFWTTSTEHVQGSIRKHYKINLLLFLFTSRYYIQSALRKKLITVSFLEDTANIDIPPSAFHIYMEKTYVN